MTMDEQLPFGQSYWDYLPDLVRDNILKMVEEQLILEAKDKHKILMQQVCCQIQVHRLWKAFYEFSDFGPYCGHCDNFISPEFSFRRHRARCSLNDRAFYVDEGGDPVAEEETDEEEWDEEERNAREKFNSHLENYDYIAEDWEEVFSQYAHVGKFDYDYDYEYEAEDEDEDQL